MNSFGKVVGYNLLALALYTILYTATDSSTGDGGAMAFFTSLFHALVAFIISIVAFVKNRNTLGKGMLLSAILVPIIGFSICLGTFTYH